MSEASSVPVVPKAWHDYCTETGEKHAEQYAQRKYCPNCGEPNPHPPRAGGSIAVSHPAPARPANAVPTTAATRPPSVSGFSTFGKLPKRPLVNKATFYSLPDFAEAERQSTFRRAEPAACGSSAGGKPLSLREPPPHKPSPKRSPSKAGVVAAGSNKVAGEFSVRGTTTVYFQQVKIDSKGEYTFEKPEKRVESGGDTWYSSLFLNAVNPDTNKPMDILEFVLRRVARSESWYPPEDELNYHSHFFITGFKPDNCPKVATVVTEMGTLRDWIHVFKLGAKSTEYHFDILVQTVDHKSQLNLEKSDRTKFWNPMDTDSGGEAGPGDADISQSASSQRSVTSTANTPTPKPKLKYIPLPDKRPKSAMPSLEKSSKLKQPPKPKPRVTFPNEGTDTQDKAAASDESPGRSRVKRKPRFDPKDVDPSRFVSLISPDATPVRGKSETVARAVVEPAVQGLGDAAAQEPVEETAASLPGFMSEILNDHMFSSDHEGNQTNDTAPVLGEAFSAQPTSPALAAVKKEPVASDDESGELPTFDQVWAEHKASKHPTNDRERDTEQPPAPPSPTPTSPKRKKSRKTYGNKPVVRETPRMHMRTRRTAAREASEQAADQAVQEETH